ncbi:hypothetical protein [Nonomuraea typhae]|uniref:hypothetical protein n=1 Tax=Nonomuraea typhae TaxID=2603600 RepID=UPI0012FB6C2E|nr:hypothetical protein [Nonomuraea typhae]
MAPMLGRQAWGRVVCSRGDGPRSVKVERAREKRDFARELLPGRFRDSMRFEDGDCLHGCNGGCVYGGSDVCTFVCHELEPHVEAVFDRLDRRAMEILNEEIIQFAEWSLPLAVEAAELMGVVWDDD